MDNVGFVHIVAWTNQLQYSAPPLSRAGEVTKTIFKRSLDTIDVTLLTVWLSGLQLIFSLSFCVLFTFHLIVYLGFRAWLAQVCLPNCSAHSPWETIFIHYTGSSFAYKCKLMTMLTMMIDECWVVEKKVSQRISKTASLIDSARVISTLARFNVSNTRLCVQPRRPHNVMTFNAADTNNQLMESSMVVTVVRISNPLMYDSSLCHQVLCDISPGIVWYITRYCVIYHQVLCDISPGIVWSREIVGWLVRCCHFSKTTSQIFMKFTRDIQHLSQSSLLAFEKLESKFNAKTTLLNIFQS